LTDDLGWDPFPIGKKKTNKKKTRKTEFLKELASWDHTDVSSLALPIHKESILCPNITCQRMWSPPKILSSERWIDREGTVQDANNEVERSE
jgi:hypothetical protein